MRIPLSYSVLFLFATYLLWSALPLAALLCGRAPSEPGMLAAGSVLSWLMVRAIFRRPAMFHVLVLPAFLALPLELYLQVYFGQGSPATIWA